MKHMKTVLILEHEEKVFEKLTCDLCSVESDCDENWAKGEYDEAATVVQLQERKAYPNGGHLRETAFHICHDCFNKKLIPWLQGQGAKPTIGESDW